MGDTDDAAAQLPVAPLRDFLTAIEHRPLARSSSIVARRGLAAGLRLSAPNRSRWVDVGGRHHVWRGFGGADLRALTDLEAGHGGLAASGLFWSPPRRLLLDRARPALRLDLSSQAPLGTGTGVVIGVVDTGVDVAHPDLRRADGASRVAWYIDFGSDPAGRHPELEAAYGCEPSSGLRCQVLSAADLDDRLQNAVSGDEPRDPLGHGTHVATIAAGNGNADPSGAFVGVAKDATLIVARITGEGGSIADSDVLLATRFVFDRASELGTPAVVNLSLGGDFGAHDGSSELSQALASFVDGDQPGRAIVVAAGNSGQLLYGLAENVSEPLGIHAEVDVEGAVTLPLLTPPPPSGGAETDASVFVWLNLYPASDLRVGLELPDGSRVEPLAVGDSETLTSGAAVAAVVHGLAGATGGAEPGAVLPGGFDEALLPSSGAAAILIDGRWAAGGTFRIQLEGAGRVEAWVQSEGDLSPAAGSVGALFPAATAQQTVTIPATHPALIAVGASVNRLDWSDATGASVSVAALPVEPALAVGGPAYFSSAGPNALGDTKPDVLAPGGFVIAGLAASADPRRGGRGVFGGGLCPSLTCQVVSDHYAVTAGTSMAAPMVSGVVALLFERDPGLTQAEVLALLQTGSSPLAEPVEPSTREGGGLVDAARTLAALDAAPRTTAERPDPSQSRFEFASEFVVPDTARSVAGLLWLRDAAGDVFDVELDRLALDLDGGSWAEPVVRVAPGLYRVRVSALPPPATSVALSVAIDGEPFSRVELPIASREPSPADDDGCGCRLTSTAQPRRGGWVWGAALAGYVSRRLLERRFRSRRGTR